MTTIDTILSPLMWAVGWIIFLFHSFFEFIGISPTSGLSWALSIVGLTVTTRVLLIPLFVRQIKAARGMQMLSPELQAIQKKYKGRSDPAAREAMSRETMELYRKHGTNPFASCLPILAQSPVFFALFRVLNNMPALAKPAGDPGSYSNAQIGPLTRSLAGEFTNATLFGARLSDSFFRTEVMSVKVVAATLIVMMTASTFFTQRQLTRKNMPESALQGPMAQQQKMMLYMLPVIFAISGVNFPLGILIYWTTTNLWTMGQQFYVIRRNPTPGSEAERVYKERMARKAAARGIVVLEPEEPEKPRGQRQQPVRKDRAKPRTTGQSVTDDSSARPAGRSPSGGTNTGSTGGTEGQGRSTGAARKKAQRGGKPADGAGSDTSDVQDEQ